MRLQILLIAFVMSAASGRAQLAHWARLKRQISNYKTNNITANDFGVDDSIYEHWINAYRAAPSPDVLTKPTIVLYALTQFIRYKQPQRKRGYSISLQTRQNFITKLATSFCNCTTKCNRIFFYSILPGQRGNKIWKEIWNAPKRTQVLCHPIGSIRFLCSFTCFPFFVCVCVSICLSGHSIFH